jgi:hypothetical protein
LLFHVVFKFLDILSKKGCYRSAFEYNKFLLKLNPLADPLGSLIMIDYTALCAKEYDWLISFPRRFCQEFYRSRSGDPEYSLVLLPNMIYSLALAKYTLALNKGTPSSVLDAITEKEFEEAVSEKTDFAVASHSSCLIAGILFYPAVFLSLLEKNEFTKQNLGESHFSPTQKKPYKELLEHSLFQGLESRPYFYKYLQMQSEEENEGIKKVMEVYPERSKLLWKSNEVNRWFKACLGLIVQKEADGKLDLEAFYEKACVSSRFLLPFSVSRFKTILTKEFSGNLDRVDLANIPDVQGGPQQAAPQPGNLDLNQNPVMLFLNSLLPWNHV